MRENFFEIGMKVQLELESDDERQSFPSKIEDLDGKNLVIGMPIKANYIYFVSLNEVVYVYFSRKDSFYRLECEVIRKRYEPIPVLILKPIRQPYKYQRRSFFRIDITLDVKVILMKNDEPDESIEGKTKDISGNGALLALPKNLKKGELVKLKIKIKNKTLFLKAKVIRSYKNESRQVNPYNVAVHFIDIDEKTQDAVVKFTLEEQRKLRKKGLI